MTTSSTSGNDFIFGSSKSEKLFGKQGNDIILGGGGNDQLTGDGGNDALVGDRGNDILHGSNATSRGANETDYAFGGGGADTYVMGDRKGSYYTAGGWGDHLYIDGFEAGVDKVQLHGKASDYFTETFRGSTWLFTKAGNDLVAAFAGLSSLDITSPNFIYQSEKPTVNRINGTAGRDKLQGTDKRDIIRGFDGRDTIFGNGGNDTIIGGNGNDVVFAGEGNDSIILSGDGFGNRDSLNGEAGDDRFINQDVPLGSGIIDGGEGTDTLSYGQAKSLDGVLVTQALNFDRNQVFFSSRGIKAGEAIGSADSSQNIERFIAPKNSTTSKFIVRGLSPASTRFLPPPPKLDVNLSTGQVIQKEGSGKEPPQLKLTKFSHFSATFQDDRLTGNGQNNILNGGGGRDVLNGKGGNDVLIGGSLGGATMTGGNGRDRFYIPTSISPGSRGPGGKVTPYDITDFRSNEEILVGQTGFNRSVGLAGQSTHLGLQELGAISEAQFGLGRRFTTPEQRFAYDTETGELFYDLNGSDISFPSPEPLGVSIKIATLKGAPLIGASNIIVANDDLLQTGAVTVPDF